MLKLPDPGSDGHIHTSLCNHAVGTMEEYVRAALKRGLHTMTFLEHLEVGIRSEPRTWLTETDFTEYFKEGSRLRDIYGGRITIRLGVEAGCNPQATERLKNALDRHPWDWIGLSYHFFAVDGTHCNLVSRRRDNLARLAAMGIDRVVTAYLDGLLEGLQNIRPDVVCHLDAVLRHHPDLRFRDTHMQQFDTLLAAMAELGVALEINTSGYDIRGQPFPGPDITARAMALDIPLIAGSDAHRPRDVGRYFDRLPRYLAKAACSSC
ncbi:histidinol-phosphatase [Thermodesulfobacteriota bacterium B35]